MAKGLIAEFFIDAVHMTALSEKEGRPIFEDREFIRIIPIGDNKTEVVKEATDEIRQRFAEEYGVFKRGAGQTFSGTPLNQWPVMTPAQIKQFNHFNVYTVDQLSDLDDIAINRVGPGTRDWVEKAKAFLVHAKNSADAQKFAAENERLKDDMAQLRATVAQLSKHIEDKATGGNGESRDAIESAELRKIVASQTATIAELRAGQTGEPARRGPGRPRKDEQAAA